MRPLIFRIVRGNNQHRTPLVGVARRVTQCVVAIGGRSVCGEATEVVGTQGMASRHPRVIPRRLQFAHGLDGGRYGTNLLPRVGRHRLLVMFPSPIVSRPVGDPARRLVRGTLGIQACADAAVTRPSLRVTRIRGGLGFVRFAVVARPSLRVVAGGVRGGRQSTVRIVPASGDSGRRILGEHRVAQRSARAVRLALPRVLAEAILPCDAAEAAEVVLAEGVAVP